MPPSSTPPWARGPWPPPPVEEVAPIVTFPCWGCGKPLKESQVRNWGPSREKPTCSTCYLKGDQWLWMNCEICGQLAKRSAPGKKTFRCPRHQEEIRT